MLKRDEMKGYCPLQTPNECRKYRGFMMNYRSEEFYARIYARKGNS